MNVGPPALEVDSVHDHLERWARLWKVPELAREIDVRFDRCLRTSLGSCSPARRAIRLHPDLKAAPPDLLLEVLCHEFAHIATTVLHGGSQQPHGQEWAKLVRAAGYEPRVRLAAPLASQLDTPDARLDTDTASGRPDDRAILYEHSCPVCHYSRIARRHVPSWRCPECSRAGEEAPLVVRTRPASPR